LRASFILNFGFTPAQNIIRISCTVNYGPRTTDHGLRITSHLPLLHTINNFTRMNSEFIGKIRMTSRISCFYCMFKLFYRVRANNWYISMGRLAGFTYRRITKKLKKAGFHAKTMLSKKIHQYYCYIEVHHFATLDSSYIYIRLDFE